MANATLSPRREAFVANYVTNGGNATQAARDAGYAAPTEEGYRLLRNAQVQQAVHRKEAALAVRADYSAAAWLRDALSDWAQARADRNWAACAAMQRNVGQHVGALNDRRALDPREAALFAQLGAAMQAAYGERAVASAGAREAIVSQPRRETAELPDGSTVEQADPRAG